MKEIYAAFPTPIVVYSIDKILTEEIFYVNRLPRVANSGNMRSKENYILRNPELKRIADFAEQCLNDFLHEIYCPSTDVSAYITQAWANYTNRGQNHHAHKHPNSFLSGVFYISVTPEDKIVFIKDSPPAIQMATNVENEWNSTMMPFTVRPGELVIFPSSLMHMVNRATTNDTRVSIAFNSYLRGTIGDAAQLQELIL
jgi:uncharacterized protein (TIGR02466 family)